AQHLLEAGVDLGVCLDGFGSKQVHLFILPTPEGARPRQVAPGFEAGIPAPQEPDRPHPGDVCARNDVVVDYPGRSTAWAGWARMIHVPATPCRPGHERCRLPRTGSA